MGVPVPQVPRDVLVQLCIQPIDVVLVVACVVILFSREKSLHLLAEIVLFLGLLKLLRLAHIAVHVLLHADAASSVDGGRCAVLEVSVALRVHAFGLLVADDVLLLSGRAEDGLHHVQDWSFELVYRHD